MHGIYFSFEERIGCAKAARPHAGHTNPTCILAACLNARGCVSFWRRMHGSAAPSKPGGAVAGQKSTPRAFWQSASMHGACVYHLTAICARANRFVTTLTNAFRHGFYMHLLPALGFGSAGPCWAFTWRFGHAQTASSQPSRMHFGTDSKRMRSPCSGLGRGAMLGLYMLIWARTNRFVTNLTNAFRH